MVAEYAATVDLNTCELKLMITTAELWSRVVRRFRGQIEKVDKKV